jgi:hypothetical protein
MLPGRAENAGVLRVARLLLVGSAAASIGVIAVIASRASALSPLLAIFAAAAVLFVLAARSLEPDPRRGRLLAVAAACALGGMGTLAGFGAGDVTFPAAALGVLAAWTAAMWRSPRWVPIAFVAYVAIGVLLSLPRLPGLLALPWLLPGFLAWPLTTLFFIPVGIPVAIYAAFGLAVALTAAAYSRQTVFAGPLDWRVIARDAVIGALAFVLLEVALALARPSTSARQELVPVAVVVMFVAAAVLAAGLRLLRSGVAGGLAATVIGAAVVLYIATARPTIECRDNGVATGSGPWWLPNMGSMASSGSNVGGGSSTGRIARGDGVTITYRCAGSELAEFEIRRSD